MQKIRVLLSLQASNLIEWLTGGHPLSNKALEHADVASVHIKKQFKILRTTASSSGGALSAHFVHEITFRKLEWQLWS